MSYSLLPVLFEQEPTSCVCRWVHVAAPCVEEYDSLSSITKGGDSEQPIQSHVSAELEKYIFCVCLLTLMTQLEKVSI